VYQLVKNNLFIALIQGIPGILHSMW